jgi:hypothetical protein
MYGLQEVSFKPHKGKYAIFILFKLFTYFLLTYLVIYLFIYVLIYLITYLLTCLFATSSPSVWGRQLPTKCPEAFRDLLY